MGLLRKVRILVGALVHKPFVPQSEKIELGERSDSTQEEAAGWNSSTQEAQSAEDLDRERVADLIAKQRQERAD
jgi:hypothetical protein